MDDLDKIRVLMAIKHGRLPNNPRITREDLEGPEFAGLVDAQPWGWSLTSAGHDAVSSWTYDVVPQQEPAAVLNAKENR